MSEVFLIGLSVGLIVGGTAGIVIMAIMQVASLSDDIMEDQLK